MPVMSTSERAFCSSALWRSSSAAVARELRAQPLGATFSKSAPAADPLPTNYFRMTPKSLGPQSISTRS
ncbi:hypothetical protein [Mycobacterium sp.]|uniref:hypothetical protein n=1 Tax=Mycobacterium sp. TaxID=1785 RepID=UPI0025DF4C0D|nr:hypothetical protein [Mycobacterium sp.]